MIIELSTRDGIPYQYYIATDFLIFNHSLNLALQRTPLLLFSVETKKNHLKEFLDCLQIFFPKLQFFKYSE